MDRLKEIIEEAWENRELINENLTREAIEHVVQELDQGMLRVAEPNPDGGDWIGAACLAIDDADALF